MIEAEVVRLGDRDPKDNARIVVTNLRYAAQRLDEEVYCPWAHIENRTKKLHHGLAIDRTNCTRFWANQFHMLLTAAAYVLFQQPRPHARCSACARAQVGTLRLLLKLGVWIDRSVRHIALHLPDSAPWRTDWRHIARSLGAVPT